MVAVHSVKHLSRIETVFSKLTLRVEIFPYFDLSRVLATRLLTHHFLEVPENGHACVVRAIVEPNRTGSAAIGGAQSRFDSAVVAGRHRSRKLVHRSSDLFILFGHFERLGMGKRPKRPFKKVTSLNVTVFREMNKRTKFNFVASSFFTFCLFIAIEVSLHQSDSL